MSNESYPTAATIAQGAQVEVLGIPNPLPQYLLGRVGTVVGAREVRTQFDDVQADLCMYEVGFAGETNTWFFVRDQLAPIVWGEDVGSTELAAQQAALLTSFARIWTLREAILRHFQGVVLVSFQVYVDGSGQLEIMKIEPDTWWEKRLEDTTTLYDYHDIAELPALLARLIAEENDRDA